jgi:hypothetical protein
MNEFINCNLINQKYIPNITSLKNKLNIDKIVTNAHDLNSESYHSTNLET